MRPDFVGELRKILVDSLSTTPKNALEFFDCIYKLVGKRKLSVVDELDVMMSLAEQLGFLINAGMIKIDPVNDKVRLINDEEVGIPREDIDKCIHDLVMNKGTVTHEMFVKEVASLINTRSPNNSKEQTTIITLFGAIYLSSLYEEGVVKIIKNDKTIGHVTIVKI